MAVIDFRIGGVRRALQQSGGRHDLACLAVSALRHVHRLPRHLNRMKAIRRKPFDGGDRLTRHTCPPSSCRSAPPRRQRAPCTRRIALCHTRTWRPLRFNTSRSTHRRGISGGTSTVAATLLTVNLMGICLLHVWHRRGFAKQSNCNSGSGYYQKYASHSCQESRRKTHPRVKPSPLYRTYLTRSPLTSESPHAHQFSFATIRHGSDDLMVRRCEFRSQSLRRYHSPASRQLKCPS